MSKLFVKPLEGSAIRKKLPYNPLLEKTIRKNELEKLKEVGAIIKRAAESGRVIDVIGINAIEIKEIVEKMNIGVYGKKREEMIKTVKEMVNNLEKIPIKLQVEKKPIGFGAIDKEPLYLKDFLKNKLEEFEKE